MANLTITEIYVDGVQLPTPKLEGVKISTNKEWSSNTGRLEQTGTMVGTIVALKRKLEISWPPLTTAQVAVIEAAVSNKTAFHTVRYVDMTGAETTMTAYFGDPQYSQYAYSEGIRRVNDVSVSAIEQ